MALEDWLERADALLDSAPLRPDRVYCGLRKERGFRLEVRHRRLFQAEYVVLADVAGGVVEAEVLIPRLLVAQVAESLDDLHRYLGPTQSNPGPGQQRLFG